MGNIIPPERAEIAAEEIIQNIKNDMERSGENYEKTIMESKRTCRVETAYMF
jgi:hypothetical protein